MVFDVHGHALDLAFRRGLPLDASLGGVTDVPMLQAGGVQGQLCATWTPDIAQSGPHSHSVASPRETLLAMLDYAEREVGGPAGARVVLARTARDLETASREGRVALVAGMEGSDALEGSVDTLNLFYEKGLRHVGLVHEHANEFGGASQVWEAGTMRAFDAARDAAAHLSSRGRELLRAMADLGIIVDLTHLVEPAFWEVLEVMAGPVLVSHGGARALTDSARYLTDQQLKAVAATGGVVGVSPTPLGPSSEAPGLSLLLAALEHLVEVMGWEHVAVGTDFKDQVGYYPAPFSCSTDTPNLIAALGERGYTDEAIAGICGDNAVRLIREVIG